MSTQPLNTLSPEAYLDLERAAEQKHEYVAGEMVAMAGGSPRHSLLAANCMFALMQALAGGTCRVFGSDLRVCIHWDRLITYPDITVVCGPLQYTDDRKDTVTNPSLIIEVLSPSTMNFDLGEKAARYRDVPSLQEFLMVHQTPVDVEHYKRLRDASWQITAYRDGTAVIPLASLDISLPVSAIYQGVEQL
jgi:Uma2 family endonuclease